ncbi:hypothetical protein ACS0TY_024288 [Phlomoides rotata]
MGYIYEVMDRAKEIIMKVFDNKENEYKDAFEIIDMRWSFQLHRSLHATGFFLNPEFFYKNGGDDVGSGVSKGFYDDMESLVPNPTFVEVHAKKRNMLEQQHMNDLVFVKYNRVLKCRYDARVHIDPISLKDIDETMGVDEPTYDTRSKAKGGKPVTCASKQVENEKAVGQSSSSFKLRDEDEIEFDMEGEDEEEFNKEDPQFDNEEEEGDYVEDD